MLGIDAIVMLYHCAKVSVGDVLEVGAYMGVRDSATEKKIISIERGAASITRGSARKIVSKI